MASNDGIAGVFWMFIFPALFCALLLNFVLPIVTLVYADTPVTWICESEQRMTITHWLNVCAGVSMGFLVWAGAILLMGFTFDWRHGLLAAVVLVPMIAFHIVWGAFGSELVWSQTACNYTAGVKAITEANIVLEWLFSLAAVVGLFIVACCC